MRNLLFNYYTISLLVGGIIAIIGGFVVYLNNRNRPDNKAWLFLTLSTAVWSFGYFGMTVSPTHKLAFFFNDLLHIAAILIPIAYLLLVLIITKFWKYYQSTFYIILAIGFSFLFITGSELFVTDVVQKVSFNFAPVPGKLYILFFVYFVTVITYGIILCLLKIREVKNRNEKFRFLYLILFTLSASIGGGSVFLTTFFPTIPPYPIFLFSIYPLISGYGILRHQLFETKLVTTHAITFTLWMVILVRIFFSNSQSDLVINTSFFILAVFFGILLIRNIMKEIRTKEELAKVNDTLIKKNIELDRISAEKTEFVSLASHQIRAPLTSLRGYISLLRDEDLGPVSPEAKDALNIMDTSCTTLATVVNDYLDVSRIEQGRMHFDFSDLDIRDLLNECVSELTPSFNKKGLTCVNNIPVRNGSDDIEYLVRVDRSKLKQVIMNIIDNAIKYTPKGNVSITACKKDAHIVRIEIQDTGLGIAPEVMPKLFVKFSRAPDASEANILGTGLGLFIARSFIEAHEGKIWAESQGLGKGSLFVIELKGI